VGALLLQAELQHRELQILAVVAVETFLVIQALAAPA
jgi:hypothetical protein